MGRYTDSRREGLVPPLPDPRELTETQRQDLCEQALEQAEQLRRGKRYREGIDLLVDVLKYGLEKPQLYFRLGNLYFDGGDLSRAEYAYKRAIAEDPNHASAHHNLGVVYRSQKRITESVRFLKKARRLELRHPRRVDVSPEQKKTLKRAILPMLGVPALILIVLVIVVLILSRGT